MVQKYCFDTAALIDLKGYWSMASFPSVWRSLEGLVDEGRALSPHAVLEEIRRGDDELVMWSRAHPQMFRPTDPALLQRTREVLGWFPDLVDASKEHEDADPYVVAQALLEQEGQLSISSDPVSCAVITQEHRRIGRVRIPHACQGYSLECFDVREVIRREGWTF